MAFISLIGFEHRDAGYDATWQDSKPMEYLERLVGEWYEYQGYFVHHDLWVGLEIDGSYECELNIVAFHPMKDHLVQVEPCMDRLKWKDREEHYRLKFEAGRKYLHRMFGARPATKLEQIALLDLPEEPRQRIIAGGRLVLLSELLAEILGELIPVSIGVDVTPERWPLLRTLHYVTEYRARLRDTLFPENKT